MDKTIQNWFDRVLLGTQNHVLESKFYDSNCVPNFDESWNSKENYIKWIPIYPKKVTHGMPLPEPPKDD